MKNSLKVSLIYSGSVCESVESYLSANLAFANTQQRVTESLDTIFKSNFKFKTSSGGISPLKSHKKFDFIEERSKFLAKAGLSSADHLLMQSRSQISKSHDAHKHASNTHFLANFRTIFDTSLIKRYSGISDICPKVDGSLLYVADTFRLAPPSEVYAR